MSRVPPIKREAVPDLADAFAQTEKRMGFLPNSQLIMAHKPKLVQAFTQLGQVVNDPSNKTSRQLRTMVGHMASKAAGCQYCVAHTGESAHHANVEDAKIAAIWEYETNPLFSPAERAALRFAQCAAAVPNAVADEDVADLRKYYSNEEIVELTAVVAYFGFLNRWNDTLATELEPSPLGFAESTLARAGWTPGKHAKRAGAKTAAE